jgi:hypothetical protein
MNIEPYIGSFQKVYLEARVLHDDSEHSPHDPVVAFEDRGIYGGFMWRIQGRSLCDENTEVYCDLDTFHDFFYDSYGNTDYLPTVGDMVDFTAMITGRFI